MVFRRLWFSNGLWFSGGCGFPPGCEFPAAVELFQRVVVFRRLWFSIGCDFSGCGFPAAVVFRRLWFSGGCDFPATLVSSGCCGFPAPGSCGYPVTIVPTARSRYCAAPVYLVYRTPGPDGHAYGPNMVNNVSDDYKDTASISMICSTNLYSFSITCNFEKFRVRFRFLCNYPP